VNLSQIGRFFNGSWIFLQCLFSVTIWFVWNLNVFNILIDISVFVMFLQSYFKLFLKCFCYVLFNVLFTCFLDGYSIVSWMVIQLFHGWLFNCFLDVSSMCLQFVSFQLWLERGPTRIRSSLVRQPRSRVSGPFLYEKTDHKCRLDPSRVGQLRVDIERRKSLQLSANSGYKHFKINKI